MNFDTGWVEPPTYKKGLDPLGVQQPCIATYAALLPGITNVTDRVAYFGFAPWLMWTYGRHNPESTIAEFVRALRRAEVLLTLIGVRHGVTTSDGFPDRHDGAMVGVSTLKDVVLNANTRTVIRPSTYATLDNVDARYFKNKRGGIGQYYLGVLRDEYHLLDEHKNGMIDFTLERGKALAEQVDKGVPGERFLRCLEADRVSVSDLDSLSAFCPCQLKTTGRSDERSALVDAVLARQPDLSENPEDRRRSIALLLKFLHAADGCKSAWGQEDDFLIACYTRGLPNGKRWSLSAKDAEVADLWAFYLRGELLSLAMQRLFREALLLIERKSPSLPTVEAAGQWCANSEPFSRIGGVKTFNEAIARVRASLPKLNEAESEYHEMSMWDAIVDDSKGAFPSIDAAVRLVLALVIRAEVQPRTIESVVGVDQIQLSHYPINLDSVTDALARIGLVCRSRLGFPT